MYRTRLKNFCDIHTAISYNDIKFFTKPVICFGLFSIFFSWIFVKRNITCHKTAYANVRVSAKDTGR
jgi:hypothetical protein